jgi:hypothetical protein
VLWALPSWVVGGRDGPSAPDDVRIAALLLQANPKVAENDAQIDAAVRAVVEDATLRQPAPDLATASGGAVAPGLDVEWAAFPRTMFDPSAALADASTLVAAKLFRNTTLNPGDRVIAKPERDRFAAWLSARAPLLHRLEQFVTSVAVQELDFLIDRGMARHVSYQNDVVARWTADQRSAAEKGLNALREQLSAAGASAEEVERAVAETRTFDPNVVCAGAFSYATRAGDDRIYLGDLARMPQSRQACTAYYTAAFEACAEILFFFRSHACLGDAAEKHVLQRLDKVLARYRVP